jgi:hypothetical protein
MHVLVDSNGACLRGMLLEGPWTVSVLHGSKRASCDVLLSRRSDKRLFEGFLQRMHLTIISNRSAAASLTEPAARV